MGAARTLSEVSLANSHRNTSKDKPIVIAPMNPRIDLPKDLGVLFITPPLHSGVKLLTVKSKKYAVLSQTLQKCN
jgi:hypothetical protein